MCGWLCLAFLGGVSWSGGLKSGVSGNLSACHKGGGLDQPNLDCPSCQLWCEVWDDHRCASIVRQPEKIFVDQDGIVIIVVFCVVVGSSVKYEGYG